jgi:cytochrome b pre-mRNA-processing protein 3
MPNPQTWLYQSWLNRNWLTRRSLFKRTAGEIYGSIVASARQSTFYATWRVPDSREGRFEMVALHVALVMRRLDRIERSGALLSRAVAEAFIVDMDDNMREIGIGDLAVPRKIKKVGAALFDRHRDYGAALDAGDGPALTGSLAAAFLFGLAEEGRNALDLEAITRYTQHLWTALMATPDADCTAGRLPLPFPATPMATS